MRTLIRQGMYFTLPIVMFLCISCTTLAADLKIDGKEKVPVGGYAELKVKLEKGDMVGWQVFPPPLQQTTLNDTLCFALQQGQTYTVGVTVVNFESKRFDQGTKTVAFDGTLPPTPGPVPPTPTPTPADGRFGLAKASRDGFKLITAANRVADAAKLASAQRSHSSAIAAGGINPDTPAGYLSAWRSANVASGVHSGDWIPWGNAVSNRLKAVNEGGLLKTRGDWAEAFNEIAEGLEKP